MRKVNFGIPRHRDSNGIALDKSGTIAECGDEEVTFPAGLVSAYAQQRIGGDFYAELKHADGSMVAGVGGTLAAACRAAIAKLEAAA